MHTPGPWGMPDIGKGLVSKKGAPNQWDGMIATVDCGDYARSRTEGLANARLIAAAPELLEALRKITNELRGTLGLCSERLRHEVGNTNVQCLEMRLSESMKVILKAEGKG